MTLTGKQRKQLRGLAHDLDPVVQVGKEGVTDAVLAQVDRALEAHELIKIRFLGGRAEMDEGIGAIARGTGAEAAGSVGHVAILFRPRADPEKRRIRI